MIDGFVMSWVQRAHSRQQHHIQVRALLSRLMRLGPSDEVVSTPINDKALCFRKANLSDPKVSEREVTQARAVPSGSGSVRLMRLAKREEEE